MGLFSKNKGKTKEEPVSAPEKAVPAKAAPAPAKKVEPKPKAERPKETKPKAAAPKETKPPAENTDKATEKPTGSYFVSPHPDGGWQVKKAKAQKALKRFKTKAEAEAYAKQVAKNQGTKVVRQKKDGKIQKEKY